jgi:hypothetical protein
MVASVLGVFSYNFFLLPATYTFYSFTITYPHIGSRLPPLSSRPTTVGYLSVHGKTA